jgi:hypothetical protein
VAAASASPELSQEQLPASAVATHSSSSSSQLTLHPLCCQPHITSPHLLTTPPPHPPPCRRRSA